MSWWNRFWHHQQVGVWFILAVLAVLFALALWRSKGSSDTAKESPEETLRRRYAAGEIDDETYEHMLRELRK